MSEGFHEYTTRNLQPRDRDGWFYCGVHRNLVMPKGCDRSIIKQPPADGLCHNCAREWVEAHGDEAAKWALAKLAELEGSVSRGDYDFSDRAAQAAYDDGWREGRDYERSDR